MRGDSSSEIARDQASGAEDQKPECDPGRGTGKLTVVSLGPGKSDYLAPAAKAALLQAEVIVGYKTYMELIEPEILAGKETLTSGMKGEIKRCRMAIAQALEGKDREVILKCRDENTPVGILRNAARKDESVRITTLSQMDESTVDMLSILLVGNSKTRIIGDRMVTPRGYLEKYGEKKRQ